MAGRDPIRAYQLMAGPRVLLTIPFRPQLTEAPLSAAVPASEVRGEEIKVVATV